MERIATIGPKELGALPTPFSFGNISAPDIPFSNERLEALAESHFLIFTPRSDITVNWFRETFGTDPSKEPCMYAQDWYLKEEFASQASLDGKWHLIHKRVLEEARGKFPEDIEHSLEGERFPSALTCTFAFFAWWLHTGGEKLWQHDFVWCSDRDHNGDRIYVGRYEDPAGMNKKGFNIHRHLSLRQAYSAAPEVTS